MLKHRVLDETEWRPALLGNLRLRLPTGDADRGLGAEGVDVLARLAASKTFASLTLTLNGGYVFVTADRTQDVWLVSGAGEYRVSSPWTVVAEVAGVLGARAAADVAVARGGVVYALTSAIRLDMAAVQGSSGRAPAWWPRRGSPSASDTGSTGHGPDHQSPRVGDCDAASAPGSGGQVRRRDEMIEAPNSAAETPAG